MQGGRLDLRREVVWFPWACPSLWPEGGTGKVDWIALLKCSQKYAPSVSWNLAVHPAQRAKTLWRPVFPLKSSWLGFPGGKESACQCRRHRFDPRSEKIPQAAEQQILSLCSKAGEPQLLSPTAWALQQEEPPKRDSCTPCTALATTREKPA